MKDEMKPCETCGQEHPWGVVRNIDRVPIYGAQPIDGCDNFRPVEDKVPAFVHNIQEIWAQTPDIDPQVEIATRSVIARIRSLSSPTEQWIESLGFLFSQVTSMRGSMVREDSKFGRLVAHTDEIVESMSHVTQLAERLELINQQLTEIRAKFDQLQEDRRVKYSAEVEAYGHFGLLPFPDYPHDSSMSDEDEYAHVHAKLHYPILGQRREEPVEPEYTDPDLDEAESQPDPDRDDKDWPL